MNFHSWPDEFRPTELRGSKREILIFYFFFSHSLSLYEVVFFFLILVEKSAHFLPQLIFFFFDMSNLILKFGDMTHFVPCVHYSFGSVSVPK